MKQKHLLYGVIGGLAVLLYFKFGRESAKKEMASGGGGASGGSGVGSPTGGTKPASTSGDCGDFRIFYKDVQNDFKWNGGKPTVTKQRLMMYPAIPSPSFRASGYNNLTIAVDSFKPVTRNVTVQEYNNACADKKTGKFDSPQVGGGANPIGIGIDQPVVDAVVKPIPAGKEVSTLEVHDFVNASGDWGEMLDQVHA